MTDSRTWKIALPLASLTAIGMLATDLYLPAVPSLPSHLGGTLAQAQWTLSSFLATLALSQILWGWASDKYGEAVIIRVGMALLIIASAICALSPNLLILTIGRALQGLGAGSATTAVPALLRKKFSDAEAVRSISAVGIAESVVPALGPVLGAALISVTDWRASFWIIAALTLALIPTVSKVTGDPAPAPHEVQSPWSGMSALLRNTEYVRLSLSYSLMFGALLMFVASSPQLTVNTFGKPVTSFSLMQCFGVAAFILTASSGGRLVDRRGISFVLGVGSVLQLVSCLAFLAIGLSGSLTFAWVILAWVLFCLGLGLRGPSSMARALSAAGPMAGQASGLLMFLSFGIASASTAAIAPFLDPGMTPISAAMFLMVGLSVLFARGRK